MKIHRNHTWEKEEYKYSYDIVVYRSFGLLYIILYRGLLFVEEQRMQRRYLHRMKSMSGKKAWLVLSA